MRYEESYFLITALLMTIGFTLFIFILGSLMVPDRKQKEAANE